MDALFDFVVSPRDEASVYEALWKVLRPPSFKKVGQLIGSGDPSNFLTRDQIHLDLIERSQIDVEIDNIKHLLVDNHLNEVGIIVPSQSQYPESLNSLVYNPKLLYYKGNSSLLFREKLVSIVGTRKASDVGLKSAGYISNQLAQKGVVIVSGLARGIDTAAHNAAIEANGETVAVLGTPITNYFPRENKVLQDYISKHHLVISQVPTVAYKDFGEGLIKSFFPERNKVMAAISEASIIVEASETSGTRIQARECIRLGKKLIFTHGMLRNDGPDWPRKMVDAGDAFVVSKVSEIFKLLDLE